MTKLNRKHGIEVGSTVRVIDGSGSKFYNDKEGQTFIVTKVDVAGSRTPDDCDDLIAIEGDDRKGQFAFRFELVRANAANGVDADGNPLFFGRSDLKSLQRVVLADGRTGIIAEEGFGHYGVCVVYDTEGKTYGSFDPALVNCEVYPKTTEMNIVEVYANPGYGNMYKQSARGDLVWKADDKAAERKAANEAVAAAEATLAKAKAELDAASAKRAAL